MVGEPQDDVIREEKFNRIAVAWSKGFAVAAIAIIFVYEAVVIALAPAGWHPYLEPLCLVPVYFLTRWVNRRRHSRL
ncbi:hypothetical protein [Actinacidiphila yeochonensis]|uniref:hypothetical protein n=1 Tax=Actinacidiphila yeochonensis TaxID=89050 RepID=UPI0012FF53DF|nr:hypothetical protein [Actinacidiphila yeochonensis]